MHFYRYAGSWVGRHPQTQQLICLNDTAYAILQAKQAGESVRELSHRLSHETDQPETLIAQEAQQLLAAFEALDAQDAPPVPAPIKLASYTPTAGISAMSSPLDTRYYQLGGARIAVQAMRDQFDKLITPVLGHLTSTDTKLSVHLVIRLDEERNGITLRIGDEAETFTSVDAVIERLLFEMVEAAYRVPRTMAVLHGSAVLKDNQAWVFVARQGSGKSTLVATLCAHGWTYLGDDTCPLSETGELIPVPSPQAIKEGSWDVLAEDYPELLEQPIYQRFGRKVRFLPPAIGDMAVWTQAWPVAALVFPSYAPTAGPSLNPLSPLEKLQELTASNSLQGDCELSEFLGWLEHKPAYRLEYSHADQAKDYLDSLLLK